jgi:2-polyprenyl-6-methoxyphenol hydroxylase-like FAD-dependent oxidoreductase
MRPALARILADATRAAGTNVRLGVTFETICQDADGVDVLLSDASRGRYDLVVGADGLFSSVRRLIMPEAPQPTYVGQGVWRAVLPRPAEVTRTHMYLGPTTKVGFNPVSRAEIYVFVTEQRTQNVRVADTDLVEPLRGLLAEFSAPLVAAVRDQLSAGSSIVYRPLESLLVPAPWSRGRVVLIGDTVHATTPHLAAGAGMGIEDAVVLAEELAACTSVGESLARFQQRRFERCRMVVENSRRLCEIEISGGSKQEHAQIMRNSMQALAVAI